MISVRRADPEKDLKVIVPMVNRFAEETELTKDEMDMTIGMIPQTLSFLAYEGNKPIGVSGIVETEYGFWGQYLWVDPEFRGGIAAGLLHRLAVRYCKGKRLRVIASKGLAHMYEKAGYTTTHHVMEKTLQKEA